MAIDANKLLNWPFTDIRQHYSSRDTILYALGVGLGHDPLDSKQLGFSSPVYPGETIRTEIWRQGKTDAGLNRAVFRSRVLERDVVVLNNGLIEYAN